MVKTGAEKRMCFWEMFLIQISVGFLESFGTFPKNGRSYSEKMQSLFAEKKVHKLFLIAIKCRVVAFSVCLLHCPHEIGAKCMQAC